MSRFKLLYSEVDYFSKLVSGMSEISLTFSARLQVFKIRSRETACTSTHKTGAEPGFCPCLLVPRQGFQSMVWAVPVPAATSVTTFPLLRYRADWSMLNAVGKKLQSITVRRGTPVL